jgi:AP-1-like transcription factor
MASTTRAGALPQFVLTPQQQNLLFRALTSNQTGSDSSANNAASVSPELPTSSPGKANQEDGSNATNAVQESPFLDYDYDFGPDSSFDFDFSGDGQAKMIGDLPGSVGKDDSKASSPENDNSDKRSHPDEDDDELEEGGGKRRESEGKVSKKPGRKPLTNEPTTVSEYPILRRYTRDDLTYFFRRGKHRTERLSGLSVSARRNISRIWRPRSKN